MKYDPILTQFPIEHLINARLPILIMSRQLSLATHLKVLGSLRRLTTLRRMVRTFWVGFHLSQGSSPD